MKNKDLQEIWWGLLALMVAIAVTTLCGCRSMYTSAREKIIVRDSINIITHAHEDTLHIIVRDTMYERIDVRDSAYASMTLDNGTYDARTGQLTGIKSINLMNIQNVWRERALIAEYELMHAENIRDSLMKAQHQEDAQREQERTMKHTSVWQWFSSMFTMFALIALFAYIICKIYERKG